MKQKICKIKTIICLVLILMPRVCVPVYASEAGRIIIADELDLLTPAEEQKLRESMVPITEYGSVAFATGEGNGEATAQSLYRQYFETSSGTIFYIDMKSRKICIFSDGEIYKVITKSRADEITNAVHSYATAGKYGECATQAFSKIYTLLQGGFIPRPMRYLHNFFISIALASMVMYLVVYISRRNLVTKSNTNSKRRKYMESLSRISFSNMTNIFEYSVYHESSSSGSSGGGSSGGGGGGGSSSGGGGSSGF